MADAKQADSWCHTANMLAMQANINRDPKRRSRPFDIYDFHPTIKRPTRRKKQAGELFSKLAGANGITVETVTEDTVWRAMPGQ